MEDNRGKRKSASWFTLVGSMLILAAIIIAILFFLNGQTIITGEFEGLRVTETLVCESKDVAYSLFAFDEADSKHLKINVAFEDGMASSISLIYKLYYHDGETISFSEARNHAAMNASFRSDGMKPDSLNAKYGIMSNGMQFSIFVKNDDINDDILKYFMIDTKAETDQLAKEKLAKSYNSVGLNCKIKSNEIEEEVNEN